MSEREIRQKRGRGDIDRMRNALYADAFEGGTFITEPLTYPTYGNAPRNAVT